MKAPPTGIGRGAGAWRVARRSYLATIVIYVLLGLIIVGQAYGQAFPASSAAFPAPGNPVMRPTAGSDDASVKAYYRYLDLQALGNLHETYLTDTVSLLELYGILGFTIVGFYFFVLLWYARSSRGDLYPVEVYNGYIAERGGPIDVFNWVVWAIMLAYAITYVAVTLTYGQLY